MVSSIRVLCDLNNIIKLRRKIRTIKFISLYKHSLLPLLLDLVQGTALLSNAYFSIMKLIRSTQAFGTQDIPTNFNEPKFANFCHFSIYLDFVSTLWKLICELKFFC